jgi:hypothetical protein
MKKAELEVDLKSRVAKVLSGPIKAGLNGGGTEYQYTCAVVEGKSLTEECYGISVYNEGTEDEFAGYTNGKEPPALESDLEIGLKLLLAEDPGAKVLVEVRDRLFKVKYSNGEIALVTLNKNKDGLLKAPGE